jgi:hypothetical protein
MRLVMDGREVGAADGETLLEVARREGASIPTLCSGDARHPFHPCRLCLVEVHDGLGTRIVTACDEPVRSGIRVRTSGPRLERLRESVIRLHLAAEPAAGQVREVAALMGVGSIGGFRSSVASDRCVMCGLCPGVCMNLEGDEHGPRLESWRKCVMIERLRSAWGEERPCRYALMGLVPGALCSHDYDCRTCPFDHEMFDRAGGRHPSTLIGKRRARR